MDAIMTSHVFKYESQEAGKDTWQLIPMTLKYPVDGYKLHTALKEPFHGGFSIICVWVMPEYAGQ